MTVSALVLTLSDDPAERAAALARLEGDPRVCVGEPTGCRFPVVTTTRTAGEGAALAEALLASEGVRLVDVVLVDLSDDDGADDGAEER